MERIIVHEIKNIDNLIVRKIMKSFKDTMKHAYSPLQRGIIMFLLSEKIVYQKDLEKEFNLRRSTISGILKTMEKNNLIIKKDNLNDARMKQIILTPEAKSQFVKIKEKFVDLDKEIVEGISATDLRIFYNVLDKIKDNLKEEDKQHV